MENVKCTYTSDLGDTVHYYFRLPEHIVDLIRTATKCPKEALHRYINESNEYNYSICRQENHEEFEKTFIETIEKIANESTEEHLYNHVVSNNGKHKFPAEIHEQMENEYGLSGNLEWYVAHFFIGIHGLIFDPAFCYGVDDDSEIGRCEIRLDKDAVEALKNILSKSNPNADVSTPEEVEGILDILKSQV